MKNRFLFVSFFAISCLGMVGCGNNPGPSSDSGTSTDSSVTPVADGPTLAKAKVIAANATRDGAICDAEALLKACSYKGTETFTKTRAFNLLYAAYHSSMPEMKCQRKYGANIITPYTDVPSEAQTAVSFIGDHGLLSKELDGDGKEVAAFNGDEDFTDKLAIYLDRFHAYYGTSLKDDFANTVNHDFLFDNPNTISKETDDVFECTNLVSQVAINDWVDAHVTSMADGANKTNVLAYKASLEDADSKGSGSCAGAYVHYGVLTNPTDYAGLFSACASMFESQGYDPLFSKMKYDAEITLSGKTMGTVDVPYDNLFATSDFALGTSAYNDYVSKATTVFKGVGFNDALSENYGSALGQFAITMGQAHTSLIDQGHQDIKNVILTDTEYGPQKFKLQDHLTAGNFNLPTLDAGPLDPRFAGHTACRFINDRDCSFQAYFAAMTDENFAGAKAMVLYNEIKANLPCNPLTAVKALNSSYGDDYLKNENVRAQYYNLMVGNAVISDYKETAAYRNNFGLISKSIMELKAALRTRISGETWLSEDGKAAAIRKIDKVRTSILASNDDASSIALPIPTFTASLYDNIKASRLLHWNLVKSHDDSSFYGDKDLEDHFTANAFYNPSANGITILFGYLAAHDDFYSMPIEKLYSDLYLCCGHELTHGFDTNGVNFDEDGKASPTWWSAADHAAYTKRVQSVIDFYTGKEILPGQPGSGTVVVSEACADCAGMRLVMDLAAKNPDFDYKAFFKNAATLFMMTTSSGLYASYFASDVHPYGRVRANCMVGSADMFYGAYGIVEGDGMYVEPSKRPLVWQFSRPR